MSLLLTGRSIKNKFFNYAAVGYGFWLQSTTHSINLFFQFINLLIYSTKPQSSSMADEAELIREMSCVSLLVGPQTYNPQAKREKKPTKLTQQPPIVKLHCLLEELLNIINKPLVNQRIFHSNYKSEKSTNLFNYSILHLSLIYLFSNP